MIIFTRPGIYFMVWIQRQEDFLRFIRFEKRFSAHTVRAYQEDLSRFYNFISGTYGSLAPEEIQPFHIRSWLASLKEQKEKETTLNRKRSSLSSFFNFLLKQKYISSNPARKLHALRQQERIPVFLRKAETENLLEETFFGSGFKGFTDRLICELLYQTGMRRNELLELSENDIEWSLRQIRILGKGNKERLIPVSDKLLAELRAYLEEKSGIENHDTNHLLVLENGSPLYPMYIYRVVKKYLSMVTTLKKRSPHILRHSFATHLLNNGADIQAIKELLGHSSLAATQIYTHTHIEKLKEIHKLSHPRG